MLYHIVQIIVPYCCLLTPHILHFTAPTDAAFAKLEQDNPEFYEKLQADTELLTNVLKGHVVNGAVMSTDLSNNQEVKPLNEEMPIIVNKGDNGSTNGILLITEGNTDAVDVIAANIKACNGYIHVIDQVLLPMPMPRTKSSKAKGPKSPKAGRKSPKAKGKKNITCLIKSWRIST